MGETSVGQDDAYNKIMSSPKHCNGRQYSKHHGRYRVANTPSVRKCPDQDALLSINWPASQSICLSDSTHLEPAVNLKVLKHKKFRESQVELYVRKSKSPGDNNEIQSPREPLGIFRLGDLGKLKIDVNSQSICGCRITFGNSDLKTKSSNIKSTCFQIRELDENESIEDKYDSKAIELPVAVSRNNERPKAVCPNCDEINKGKNEPFLTLKNSCMQVKKLKKSGKLRSTNNGRRSCLSNICSIKTTEPNFGEGSCLLKSIEIQTFKKCFDESCSSNKPNIQTSKSKSGDRSCSSNKLKIKTLKSMSAQRSHSPEKSKITISKSNSRKRSCTCSRKSNDLRETSKPMSRHRSRSSEKPKMKTSKSKSRHRCSCSRNRNEIRKISKSKSSHRSCSSKRPNVKTSKSECPDARIGKKDRAKLSPANVNSEKLKIKCDNKPRRNLDGPKKCLDPKAADTKLPRSQCSLTRNAAPDPCNKKSPKIKMRSVKTSGNIELNELLERSLISLAKMLEVRESEIENFQSRNKSSLWSVLRHIEQNMKSSLECKTDKDEATIEFSKRSCNNPITGSKSKTNSHSNSIESYTPSNLKFKSTEPPMQPNSKSKPIECSTQPNSKSKSIECSTRPNSKSQSIECSTRSNTRSNSKEFIPRSNLKSKSIECACSYKPKSTDFPMESSPNICESKPAESPTKSNFKSDPVNMKCSCTIYDAKTVKHPTKNNSKSKSVQPPKKCNCSHKSKTVNNPTRSTCIVSKSISTHHLTKPTCKICKLKNLNNPTRSTSSVCESKPSHYPSKTTCKICKSKTLYKPTRSTCSVCESKPTHHPTNPTCRICKSKTMYNTSKPICNMCESIFLEYLMKFNCNTFKTKAVENKTNSNCKILESKQADDLANSNHKSIKAVDCLPKTGNSSFVKILHMPSYNETNTASLNSNIELPANKSEDGECSKNVIGPPYKSILKTSRSSHTDNNALSSSFDFNSEISTLKCNQPKETGRKKSNAYNCTCSKTFSENHKDSNKVICTSSDKTSSERSHRKKEKSNKTKCNIATDNSSSKISFRKRAKFNCRKMIIKKGTTGKRTSRKNKCSHCARVIYRDKQVDNKSNCNVVEPQKYCSELSVDRCTENIGVNKSSISVCESSLREKTSKNKISVYQKKTRENPEVDLRNSLKQHKRSRETSVTCRCESKSKTRNIRDDLDTHDKKKNTCKKQRISCVETEKSPQKTVSSSSSVYEDVYGTQSNNTIGDNVETFCAKLDSPGRKLDKYPPMILVKSPSRVSKIVSISQSYTKNPDSTPKQSSSKNESKEESQNSSRRSKSTRSSAECKKHESPVCTCLKENRCKNKCSSQQLTIKRYSEMKSKISENNNCRVCTSLQIVPGTISNRNNDVTDSKGSKKGIPANKTSHLRIQAMGKDLSITRIHHPQEESLDLESFLKEEPPKQRNPQLNRNYNIQNNYCKLTNRNIHVKKVQDCKRGVVQETRKPLMCKRKCPGKQFKLINRTPIPMTKNGCHFSEVKESIPKLHKKCHENNGKEYAIVINKMRPTIESERNEIFHRMHTKDKSQSQYKPSKHLDREKPLENEENPKVMCKIVLKNIEHSPQHRRGMCKGDKQRSREKSSRPKNVLCEAGEKPTLDDFLNEIKNVHEKLMTRNCVRKAPFNINVCPVERKEECASSIVRNTDCLSRPHCNKMYCEIPTKRINENPYCEEPRQNINLEQSQSVENNDETVDENVTKQIVDGIQKDQPGDCREELLALKADETIDTKRNLEEELAAVTKLVSVKGTCNLLQNKKRRKSSSNKRRSSATPVSGCLSLFDYNLDNTDNLFCKDNITNTTERVKPRSRGTANKFVCKRSTEDFWKIGSTGKERAEGERNKQGSHDDDTDCLRKPNLSPHPSVFTSQLSHTEIYYSIQKPEPSHLQNSFRDIPNKMSKQLFSNIKTQADKLLGWIRNTADSLSADFEREGKKASYVNCDFSIGNDLANVKNDKDANSVKSNLDKLATRIKINEAFDRVYSELESFFSDKQSLLDTVTHLTSLENLEDLLASAQKYATLDADLKFYPLYLREKSLCEMNEFEDKFEQFIALNQQVTCYQTFNQKLTEETSSLGSLPTLERTRRLWSRKTVRCNQISLLDYGGISEVNSAALLRHKNPSFLHNTWMRTNISAGNEC